MHDLTWESVVAVTDHSADAFVHENVACVYMTLWPRNDIRKLDSDAIIQLMHSFEVDIRICQLENSDVHRGEAEVNITFKG